MPLASFLKINIDAAVRDSFVAIACICHNQQGTTTWARSEIFPRLSPFKAELLAIRMAAGEALSRGLQKVMFESDCLSVVVGVCDSSLVFDADVNCWLEAIWEMASSYPSWSFVKVSRQANASADSLAKWAAERKFVGCIPLSVLPAFLLKQTLVFEPS